MSNDRQNCEIDQYRTHPFISKIESTSFLFAVIENRSRIFMFQKDS